METESRKISSPSIIKWVREEKERVRKDLISMHYEEGSKRLENACAIDYGHIDRTVFLMIDLVNEKKLEAQRQLYPFFTHLSHNRRIAFLFQALTQIDVGTTNKRGMEAFVEYFGSTVPDEVKAAQDADTLKREQYQKDEKQKKEDEVFEYFNDSIWDQTKVAKITPMQFGRLKKMLDKQWRFNGVVQTAKENLLSSTLESKHTTNNMHKWSNKKSNNMYGDEQREYEAKLLKGRSYYVSIGKGYSREVKKMVYDLLLMEDTTNQDALSKR